MKEEKVSPVVITVIALMIVLGLAAFFKKEEVARVSWILLKNPELSMRIYPNAELAMQIGNHYFNTDGNGNYNLAKARAAFEKALSIDSMVPDAWHQLARIDFLESNFGGALEKINTQIELHGNSFMASYYMRGLIYAYRKEFGDAEKDFQTYIASDKKNWAAHNDLAWVYFEEGKYAEAKKVAQNGLLFNANNPWLWNMVGISLMNLGKLDAAHAALLKALEEVRVLDENDWHRAYPGNNPLLASQGLMKMRQSIEFNIGIIVGKRL
ncbi:MAG TPA: tetratricopeptide repeat protein [Candidatus Paceibacterota bacterium]